MTDDRWLTALYTNHRSVFISVHYTAVRRLTLTFSRSGVCGMVYDCLVLICDKCLLVTTKIYIDKQFQELVKIAHSIEAPVDGFAENLATGFVLRTQSALTDSDWPVVDKCYYCVWVKQACCFLPSGYVQALFTITTAMQLRRPCDDRATCFDCDYDATTTVE